MQNKRQVNYLSTTLFDSTAAKFKLTVESRVRRRRQEDNSMESLCYVNVNGNMNLNPNIYLVFTYRGDSKEETKSLYTSYPQLFKIRDALETMKNIITSDDSFQEIEGVLTVKPQYKDGIVITDIGKEKKWMSIAPKLFTSSDEMKQEKGVVIQIAGQNNFASLLTIDEFLTIYTIVKDIDLVSIQIQVGLFSILNNDQAPAMNQAYGQPYQQQYQQQYYQPQQYQQQTPVAPRYNQGVSSNRQMTTGGPSRNYTQSYTQPRDYSQTQPQQSYTPPQSSQSTLKPRETSQPLINMNAVDSVKVDSTNWDDDDSLEAFLND